MARGAVSGCQMGGNVLDYVAACHWPESENELLDIKQGDSVKIRQ